MLSRVLFITPRREDAARLGQMLNRISIPCDHAATVEEARDHLGETRYGVVLTESALPDGTWLDILEAAHRTTPEPDVVVTRALVDGRFWCEVLNLGGHDMLAQPFSESEVQRVLANACARAA